MSRFQAAIFDLDGTLWDASAATAAGWSAAALEYNLQGSSDVAAVRSVSGLPFVACIQKLFGITPDPRLQEQLQAAEKAHILGGHWSIYPGIPEALSQLKNRLPLYLVSNCQEWYLQYFLQNCGFGSVFTKSLSNGGSGLGKAHMIEKIKSDAGHESVVYLGDTHWDQIATYQAGSTFAFAEWGFGRPEVSCPRFASIEDFAPYCVSDAPDSIAVVQLHEVDFPEAQKFYLKVGYKFAITPKSKVVAARNQVDGKIVGVVRIEFDHGTAVLRGMQVAPEFQASGVGLRMIRLLETLIPQDCYCLPYGWLEKFYGKIGFYKMDSVLDAPEFLRARWKEAQKKYSHVIIMKRDFR